MSDYPSKAFSSGTEYEIFKYNYCEICRHHKTREDGFPALVEDGGCPIEDAMEYARFDISMYPNKMIREIRNNDKVEKYHHCLKFEPNGQLKEQRMSDEVCLNEAFNEDDSIDINEALSDLNSTLKYCIEALENYDKGKANAERSRRNEYKSY